MESSAKIGKFFYWRITGALFWVKNIKVPFGIGHPPPTHQTYSIFVQEGSGVTNLQTELNYLASFKFYCIFSNCKWLPPWRHPCLSCLKCMCMCVCMHVCTCVLAWGTPYTHTQPHPHPPTPSTPKG